MEMVICKLLYIVFMEKMWQERKPLYAACADRICANDTTLEKCVQLIREGFDEALCAQRT